MAEAERQKTIMRMTAGGIIIRAGRVLLGLRQAKSGYYPDCWDIFGGHCEAGETPAETLRRELYEELGITVLEFSAYGMFEEPQPDRYGAGQHYIFVVSTWDGTPGNLGEEHAEIRWFTWEELQTVKLASEEYLSIFQPLLG